MWTAWGCLEYSRSSAGLQGIRYLFIKGSFIIFFLASPFTGHLGDGLTSLFICRYVIYYVTTCDRSMSCDA
jgi:hypothetical protein